jgi:hypothetical protein
MIIKKYYSVLALTLMTSCFVKAADQSILNMKVKESGIYRVTYTEMMNLGIDLQGVSLDEIAVSKYGNKIAAKLVSDDSTTFGVNSYIEFIGEPEDNLYQDGIVYSVVLSGAKNIDQSNLTAQANQNVERYYTHVSNYADNLGYSFGSPTTDPWFYKRILAIGSLASVNIDFYFDHLTPDGNINMSINAWGGTDYPQSPDHHVIYELNGQLIDDFRFDGVTEESRSYQLKANQYNSGLQQLIVKLPNDTNTTADVLHIESLNISYPREFLLIDNKLNFKHDGSSTSQVIDPSIIFSNGFEDSQNSVNSINNYSIALAANENYHIYQVYNNGLVTSVNSINSGNCSNTANASCYIDFSIKNDVSHLYIAADSQLLAPELTLPVIHEDINSGEAQYLIITHPDFIGNSLNNFIIDKQNDFSVKLVDVEQIYAQYGNNNISANSIAEYIKYAQRKLGVTNVLLVGGDTYDYKNILGLNSVSFIPTIYASTDDLIHYAPVDAKFADVDNDNIPDINIGRFPVRSELELENLLQKIDAYKQKNYSNTAIFAADKFDVSTSYSFKNDAESLINLLPTQWQANITDANKAYVDDDGVVLAKSKINDNINQGVALTSFIGHSGPRDWSFSRMFSTSDALLLSNSTNPTLVTQWGCWNTYFVSPTEDTLAHAFMLNQNGGAASVLGASTLTVAEHEKGLANLVLVFLTHNQMTLGDAVTEAKRVYAQENPDALDVILGWNILGDPSLKL